MKFSKIGRIFSALVATAALGLGMTACGGGTIGYMWIVGTFYNQISGFKIDNYTGNLTVIPKTPFSTNGTNPVTVLVKPGGRFVYVINSGSTATAPTATTLATQTTPGNIAVYSVGGEGVLTYQQSFSSQGIHPVWATFDGTGNFLYVVDQYAPNNSGNGSITAFTVTSDTGRLSLLQNAAIKNSDGTLTNYFSVGPNPKMAKVGGGSCLYTLSPNVDLSVCDQHLERPADAGDDGSLHRSGRAWAELDQHGYGDLRVELHVPDGRHAEPDLLADGGDGMLAGTDQRKPADERGDDGQSGELADEQQRQVSVCAESELDDGHADDGEQHDVGVHDRFDGQAGDADRLSESVLDWKSGPVCMVQDPSNQYLYTSNNTDSTVTGKQLRQDTGTLAPLTKGSVFPTTMNPTCLVVSGSL